MSVEGMRQVPLLARLPEHRLKDLASRFPVRTLSAGQVVARSGDQARLVILQDGELIGVHDTAEGVRMRLATAVGPCVIDKAAALAGGVHTATWTASTGCQVRMLPAATLERLLDEEPELRRHVVRHLADAVNAERRSRVRRAALSSQAHVASWLVEASARQRIAVPLIGGQQGLAEELGLSRVTVNRALQGLVALGAVRVRLRSVEIIDPGLLIKVGRGNSGLGPDR